MTLSEAEAPVDEQGLDDFVDDARAWLDAHAERVTEQGDVDWGTGPDLDVAVFHALSEKDERALLERRKAWTQVKAERGYHAIDWPERFGGLGLTDAHRRAFANLEHEYILPSPHETHSVTVRLIAPTVRIFGTEQQLDEVVADLLAARVLCCQLFSEPGAGSDLAGLSCRAERDGDEWVINGQKVWSSGARFSEWGELIVRTDPEVAKHRGLTAFLLTMDLPGIEIRPIKQMSGGSSFNEVFFDDVRVPDSMRLGEVGEGWKVALSTLGFERDHSDGSGGSTAGGSWAQLRATAIAMGVTADPVMRQRLATVYIQDRVEHLVNQRAADVRRSGSVPGPEGSLGKLLWTNNMSLRSDVISQILGASLVADSGEWGTFVWSEHVCGAPGYRIAGGSDEVQRNIIGERVLDLPPEPRVDKDVPWSDVPR